MFSKRLKRNFFFKPVSIYFLSMADKGLILWGRSEVKCRHQMLQSFDRILIGGWEDPKKGHITKDSWRHCPSKWF